MNWKAIAKYYRSQFLLWVKAYNEIGDRYMIDRSVTKSDAVTFRYVWSPEDGLVGLGIGGEE